MIILQELLPTPRTRLEHRREVKTRGIDGMELYGRQFVAIGVYHWALDRTGGRTCHHTTHYKFTTWQTNTVSLLRSSYL